MSGSYGWYGSQILGRQPLTLDGRIWAMQFTPEGKALLTVSDNIDQIEWPSKNRRIIWQPYTGETMVRATFSPDGTLFARSENGDKVHVHETATGKFLYKFQGRTPRLTATAWSPDSDRLAIGVGHEVVIYDMNTGTAVQKIAFGDRGITALAWSPDDKWIVAGTEKVGEEDKSVLLRSLHDDSAPILLLGNRDTRFSFSPDSTILAVASMKTFSDGGGANIFYLWDLGSGKEIVSRGCRGYNSIVHSPDGRFVVACGLNNLEILDAQTGREACRRDSDAINCHVWSIAFSPDGKILATGNEDQVRFLDTTTWNEIDPDDVLRVSVSALAFSGNGRHLVTGGMNGDLVLWDWEKKEPVWKCLEATKAWCIHALSIDPTGRWIGVVQPSYQNWPRLIRLVDFATGKEARWVEVPRLNRVAPLFHPSRRTAYLATCDHEIVEWEYESGEVLHKFPIPLLGTPIGGAIRQISAMGFDPATPEIIWWNAENIAFGRIDVRDGVESCVFETGFVRRDFDPIPPRGHDFASWGELDNRSTVRHPSGLLQFSASDQTVRVFDILTQSFLHTFHVGPGKIKAIALSPDGRTLIAASSGGVHYFWIESPLVAAGTSPEVLWRVMASGNQYQWQAYQAAWALGRLPDYLRFIESHLPPARELGAEELARLKEILSDSDHHVRQSAARLWLDLGQEINRETLETLREGGLSENRLRRISSLSGRIGPIPLLTPLSAHRRAMLAVMVLKEDRSEGSRHLLKQLADGYAGAPLTKAAAKALASQR